MVETCRVTGGLLDALLELAAAREPEAVSALLAVTPAGELVEPPGTDDGGGAEPGGARRGRPDGPAPRDSPGDVGADQGTADPPDGGASVAPARFDPAAPVFTDVYLPAAGRSVDAVFGMDVSVPHGQAQGRFVSHPRGERSVSTGDDLHEVVLVAVPPWSRDDVAAFDRGGRRLDLDVVAAAPPERVFEG